MTPPTVTQQDRDAVGDYFEKVGDRLRAKLARCGEYDASVAVQAFARHREQARADAEREIVTWLRKLNPHASPSWIARQIESGASRHG